MAQTDKADEAPAFIAVGEGGARREIAVRVREGAGPPGVWTVPPVSFRSQVAIASPFVA